MSLTHPVDLLSGPEKCRIYYSRIVDLAVVSGLLDPDPASETGHFAFSSYYSEGKRIDRDLQAEIVHYAEEFPQLARNRRDGQNLSSLGAAADHLLSDNATKLQELIVVGASQAVWPRGTSFALTYPWDLDGTGQPVRFRDDLSPFMKRRVVDILRRAGKLRHADLFNTGP